MFSMVQSLNRRYSCCIDQIALTFWPPEKLCIAKFDINTTPETEDMAF